VVNDARVGGTDVLAERYALNELIGSGGMADVYRGTDQVLGRPVALKLLREVTATAAERARFSAEARTLAQLNHPGLVTVLDAGSHGEQPYLVMEYVDGPSLAEQCDEGALPPARVAMIGARVAEALAYVHGRGIAHRDVKPSNVLLGPDGRAQLTDFGIARLIGDTARHTSTGVIIGTAAYLSPEQVRGHEVTTSSDVYSLALTLLEALTGSRTYRGSPTEAALARLTAPPVIPDSLSSTWRELLEAMTNPDPGGRPSAEDVARTLRRLSSEVASPRRSNDEEKTRTLALQPPGRTGVAEARGSRAHRSGSGGRWGVPPWFSGWLAVAIVAGFLVLLVVGFVAGVGSGQGVNGTGGGGSTVPQNVPPGVEKPLQDLHDTINGGTS
jgi:serine/threonine protein kinase